MTFEVLKTWHILQTEKMDVQILVEFGFVFAHVQMTTGYSNAKKTPEKRETKILIGKLSMNIFCRNLSPSKEKGFFRKTKVAKHVFFLFFLLFHFVP